MATHDYVIANQGFPAFRSDLNDALAAIVSNNSSATEPTTMFAHMIWVDTAANPSIIKIRNADNDAWITIGSLNQTADTFTLTSAVSATTLNTSGAVVFNDAGADVDFRVESDNNANMLFVDGGNDRVGMGTDSPSGVLHLSANTQTTTLPSIVLQDTGVASTRLASITNNGGDLILAMTSSLTDLRSNITLFDDSKITFSTAATERMRIDSSGNLLVGTTSAFSGGERLAVGSSAADWNTVLRNTAASAPYGILIQYTNASPNGTSNHFLFGSDSTTSRFQLRSNGGLANYTANDVNLSDERVKKDIADLGSQWNCIKEWNLVEFRYKEQEESAPKNYGVIAQQIQEHCPEVVTIFQEAAEAVEAKEAVLDEEGNIIEPAVEARPALEERIGVREQQMLWMAVKALQEAMERIETLEAKVAALEGN